jgi:exopolysaccharide biosynthesis protein
MKQKKLLPVWLTIVIDLAVIAVYVLGFYGLYYLVPRELESSGVRTVPVKAETQESDTDSEEAASVESVNDTEKAASSEESNNGTGEEASTGDTEGMAANNSDTGSEAGVTADNPGTGSESNTAEGDTAGESDTESLAAKFAEHFTDTVVTTDTTYSSKDISVTVNKYTKGSGWGMVTYYVADIYLADIQSFQSGFADGTYGVGYTERVLSMDSDLNAILAMNGDYYGNGGNGVVIRNGEVYRDSVSNLDVCVLYYDGTMKTFAPEEFDVEQAIADGAWQAWSFGPGLLNEDGTSKTSFNADGHIRSTNPRSVLGYYEPGHYCYVVVDGRQNGYSVGMDIQELSDLMAELGCTAAYNMDGGKSSSMTFNDATVNQPCDGGREVSDCILIKEVE